MTSVFAFQASIFKNKLHKQIFYDVRKNTCVLKYVRITQSTYNSIECWCANTKSRIKLYEENLLFSTLMPLISNLPLNWALIIILQFKQEYSLSVNSLKTHPETASLTGTKQLTNFKCRAWRARFRQVKPLNSCPVVRIQYFKSFLCPSQEL